jgi:lipopolysaccharide transport system permease protein
MAILDFERKDIRLTYNLFRMMLRDRYLGSRLGLIWAILNPILLLGMYTFVFGFIFKSRVPGSETTLAYAIWLISGFVPYLFIADSLSSTANSVVSGSELIKNIVFNSETLILASTLVAMIPFAVGMTFLICLLSFDGNYPTWHIISLVPVVIFHLTFLAGLGFFLGATSVFVRDIIQALPTITLMIVFFSPILYPMELLPGPIRRLTFLNPFYQICQPYRDVLLYHRFPDILGVAYLAGFTLVLMLGGLKYFRRLKGHFDTVL